MRRYMTREKWSSTFDPLLSATYQYDPSGRRSKMKKGTGYRFTVVMADGSKDTFLADYSEMRESMASVLFYRNGAVFRMIGVNGLVSLNSVLVDLQPIRKSRILDAINALQDIERELETFRRRGFSLESCSVAWNDFPSRVRKVWEALLDDDVIQTTPISEEKE